MNTFQRIIVGLMSAGLLAVSVDAALASNAVVKRAFGATSPAQLNEAHSDRDWIRQSHAR